MALPKNTNDPCNCRNGWFYINDGSIEIVRDETTDGKIIRITRRQLQAALKLMRPIRRKDKP